MKKSLKQRLNSLSPAKCALLEKKLKEKSSRLEMAGSIPAYPDNNSAPLTFNQEGLLFMEKLNPDTPTYNLYEAVRLSGRLDLRVLHQTLDMIVARHGALRLTFEEFEGKFQQIARPAAKVPLQIVDFSPETPEEREKLVIEALSATASAVFDPAAEKKSSCPQEKADG